MHRIRPVHALVAHTGHSDTIRPLVYPLVQVLLGTANVTTFLTPKPKGSLAITDDYQMEFEVPRRAMVPTLRTQMARMARTGTAASAAECGSSFRTPSSTSRRRQRQRLRLPG